MSLQLHGRDVIFYHPAPQMISMVKRGTSGEVPKALALPDGDVDLNKWSEDLVSEALVWLAKGV